MTYCPKFRRRTSEDDQGEERLFGYPGIPTPMPGHLYNMSRNLEKPEE